MNARDPVKVAVSLRVDCGSGGKDRRDGLSRRWSEELARLNVAPLLVPNGLRNLRKLLSYWRVDAILLTGGNRAPAPGAPPTTDVTPDRDRTERELIRHARAKDLPLIGVGRGAQMLHMYFGGTLRCDVDSRSHVSTTHPVHLDSWLAPTTQMVRSDHDFVICPDALPADLVGFAWADDGTVEGFHHRRERILGIMWQPELSRGHPAALLDLVEKCLHRHRPWLEWASLDPRTAA